MNRPPHRPLALDSLRSFEAVARHLSFSAAAEELHLTQPAVSRQIKGLEDDLGAVLFHRATRRVELSSAGHALLRAVSPALARIDTAVRQIRMTRSREMVSVTTFPSMASLWLMPRLPDFERQHPGADIRIAATDRMIETEDFELDVALRHCRPDKAQPGSERLFGEVLTPVIGAALNAADMAAHRLDWVEPIGIDYRGYTLHEIPPNGQGIAALITLGILENFDMASMPIDSPDNMHLKIEAMKLAFADINEYVSDPATMRVTPAQMLDKAYLKERAKLIDLKKAQVPTHGHPAKGGTVYLTAADESGMMVSYIQSNFSGFGSGVVVPGTGIAMQNRGTGFSLLPGHANIVAGSKRPFHTIIPGFLTKGGQPVMSFGVMGGSMQAQGHSQVMVRFADYGQNPQAAADAPRWRVDTGLKVGIEQGVSEEVFNELKSRGHDLTRADRWSTDFGRAQLIFRMEDGYLAASERRTDGQAVGF